MMLYLASASPRRSQLLNQLAVPHQQFSVDIDETPHPGEEPSAYVHRLAQAKAEAGLAYCREQAWHGPVLGADTAVVCAGQIFGKPRDVDDAQRMLRQLSGQRHQVMSGIALAHCEHPTHVRVQISQVRFCPLDEARIAAYIASGEPFGKAGGYAIQGRAAAFIEHLEGSYSGVMGLPLFETAQLLASLDNTESRQKR